MANQIDIESEYDTNLFECHSRFSLNQVAGLVAVCDDHLEHTMSLGLLFRDSETSITTQRQWDGEDQDPTVSCHHPNPAWVRARLC